jgi:hypothetical protein
MRLDQTHVRVRERNVLEILDLTFQIIRAYWRPFFILSLMGALPLALINHGLTAWLLDEGQGGSELPLSFMWHQTLLVFVEAPLGSLLLTTYLGHAVFSETPGFLKIIRDVLQGAGKIFWTVVILRGVALLLLVMLFATLAGGAWSPWRVILVSFGIATVLLLRVFRPFVLELIVLEQPNWRSNDPQHPSFGQRSGQIHNAASGMLLGRGLLFMAVACIMTWIVFGGVYTVAGMFTHNWYPEGILMTVVWSGSLWMVVGYMTVVRFLNYLDVRIRQEGWEVELLIRAEAQKLTESLV